MSARRIDGASARPRNPSVVESDVPDAGKALPSTGASATAVVETARDGVDEGDRGAAQRSLGRDPGTVQPALDPTGVPRQDGALQLLTQKQALSQDGSALDTTPAAPERAVGEGPAEEPIAVTSQIKLNTRSGTRLTLGKPRERDRYAFRGVRQDALEYPAQVGAHRFAIVVPAGPKADEQARDIARSLVGLSATALGHVKRVVKNPVKNPEDAFWAERYSMPDFKSAMTAGRTGEITIYPHLDKRLDKVTGSLAHEIGHIVSKQAWGENYSNNSWTRWKQAGSADGRSASDYATRSAGEDFAETYALYVRTQGSSKHAQYRRKFPNRFAIIDGLVGD